MKEYSQIIELLVYPIDVHVFFGTEKKFKKYLKKFGLKKYDIDISGMNGDSEGRCYDLSDLDSKVVIWLNYIPKTAIKHAGLQHEIFHAAEFIMRYSGIKHCDETTEAWAYLIQSLTQEIYVQYWEVLNNEL